MLVRQWIICETSLFDAAKVRQTSCNSVAKYTREDKNQEKARHKPKKLTLPTLFFIFREPKFIIYAYLCTRNRKNAPIGEMPEWPIGPDSKSGERLVRSGGLNPSLSAETLSNVSAFFLYRPVISISAGHPLLLCSHPYDDKRTCFLARSAMFFSRMMSVFR